jgi:2-polyprenyl-3-methyl-5-hydroxy-6-metoxy-1,4-benzoquinol methylase
MMNKEIAYDHANPVILSYLLSHVSHGDSILDVGCWSGKLGATLLTHKKCIIDGIEKENNKGKLAIQRGYQRVLLKDINALTDSDIKRKYDWIVLGDVLEHVIDPDTCIQILKNKLKHNGCMAVSLPNIGFLWYRWLHLMGRWQYEDAGIMDRTHLRFFTLSSMKKFFENNGLDIIFYHSLNAVQRKFFFFEYLGILFPSLFALQCVFVVKPKNI